MTAAKSRPDRFERNGGAFRSRDGTDMNCLSSSLDRANVRWRKSMAAKTNFRGSLTALVTPFKNGALDEAAFRGLVSWQVEQGSHGLGSVGTTGESPTLSHVEHNR